MKKASKVKNSENPIFTCGEYRIRTDGLLPSRKVRLLKWKCRWM